MKYIWIITLTLQTAYTTTVCPNHPPDRKMNDGLSSWYVPGESTCEPHNHKKVSERDTSMVFFDGKKAREYYRDNWYKIMITKFDSIRIK